MKNIDKMISFLADEFDKAEKELLKAKEREMKANDAYQAALKLIIKLRSKKK